MHIGINLWTTPSTWWPSGASYAADFAGDRYMRDGEPVAANAAFGLVRGSTKYAADGSGSFVPFGANIAARTDLGLLVEPASSNMLSNPVGLETWLTTMASATPLPGPVLGIFTQPMLVTDTAGNAVARLRHAMGLSVVAEQSYALSFWLRAGSTPNVGVIASGDGGSSRLGIALPDGGVTTSTSGRGAMTLAGLVQPAPNIYCAQVRWTPSYSGSCEVAIGPGTGVIGDTVIALGAFMEVGTRFTSPILDAGGRAADNLTLHLPEGTHELTFTFADGSTQVIAGASGEFAVPTNLDRAVIRRVVGVAS
ncbi:hypothetical protein [Devosia ginsengisoli]|uniref:phage head spike fiber domain-containing protein n=1 Tax=Devosia ginsengisoli TaxID=400770 RepID=UPI0026F11F89|nr:hypothetical protein [Devosia ginsengisoli]MCR6673606.1 hypothetical protein [Devosia ginsengisoli]